MFSRKLKLLPSAVECGAPAPPRHRLGWLGTICSLPCTLLAIHFCCMHGPPPLPSPLSFISFSGPTFFFPLGDNTRQIGLSICQSEFETPPPTHAPRRQTAPGSRTSSRPRRRKTTRKQVPKLNSGSREQIVFKLQWRPDMPRTPDVPTARQLCHKPNKIYLREDHYEYSLTNFRLYSVTR